MFKALALGLTLALPPERFDQLKQWYARKGLRRFREKLGDAAPANPVRVLRHAVEWLPENHGEA